MALRNTTASADLTSFDSHSALPCTNSANLEEIAAGPQPRSTITWRPGQITRSRIQLLTCAKNGCRVNGVNEKRSSSAVGFKAVTVCESRAVPDGRRDCD